MPPTVRNFPAPHARAKERPFLTTQKRLTMPSRISNTSSFHSAYTAPSQSDTHSSGSVSQRSLATNASLNSLARRASTAAGSSGSDTGSVYGSVASHSPSRSVSDVGSSTRNGLSHSGSETYYAANSDFGSEADWDAQGSADDIAGTLSQAGSRRTDTIRRSTDSSHHSRGSDWIDMNFTRSARGSTPSGPSSVVSSEHHSRSGDWIDIDPRGTGQRSVVGSDRRSEIAETLSHAGTSSERSFHLSERGSVVAALRDGRLGYSSDSSRRLTAYEGSSRANGSVAPSYVSSLTPSDRSALRAARLGGRFAAPSSIRSNRTSLDSDYEAYLHEGDDVVAPLRASRFRPIPSAAPSDPDSVAAAIGSRRIDRTPSLSRHIGDSRGSSRFGGADVESLASAGSQRRSAPGPRPLWELLKEDH